MNTTLASLQKLFDRDLEVLYKEIESYPSEATLWLVKGDIKNSGGNLCLHLCGNLQHFVGTILGKTGYVRNRDAEFADKNVPRAKLLGEIRATQTAVKNTLANLDPSTLEKDYPINVFGEPMTTNFFLIHLEAHLNYHRGQVNYHRRLVAISD